jgi:hypothetical protein
MVCPFVGVENAGKGRVEFNEHNLLFFPVFCINPPPPPPISFENNHLSIDTVFETNSSVLDGPAQTETGLFFKNSPRSGVELSLKLINLFDGVCRAFGVLLSSFLAVTPCVAGRLRYGYVMPRGVRCISSHIWADFQPKSLKEHRV